MSLMAAGKSMTCLRATPQRSRVQLHTTAVAQTSKPAVSLVSQACGVWLDMRSADLEIGDTAGWETCATSGAPTGLAAVRRCVQWRVHPAGALDYPGEGE